MLKTKTKAILLTVFLAVILFLQGTNMRAQAADFSKGFTGPEVPGLNTMLGDSLACGAFNSTEQRMDIPKLMEALKKMCAKDFLAGGAYPNMWDDFQLMAPEFQKAGIRLWFYSARSPSLMPAPYFSDFVGWAKAVAELSNQYPVVRGIVLDDFDTSFFTVSYSKNMMNEAHKIAPQLSLLVISYYGGWTAISAHVRQGAIDGIVFPYLDLSNTAQLLTQINTFRKNIDLYTVEGGFSQKMPIVAMIYGVKHSFFPDVPTPEYVKTGLSLSLKATTDGVANGAATFCLPKGDLSFVNAVSEVYGPAGGCSDSPPPPVDTTSPTINITCPPNNKTYSSNSISLSGTASDNIGVSKVEVKIGSGVWKTATGTTSWSVSDITLASGANTVTARVMDAAGNAKETAITVTYDPTAVAQPSGLRAFPEAEGGGAESVGGRGGRVIHVTNLNSEGPGSLREAMEATGPRIVVFNVSGIIKLKSMIRLYSANSYITVAGQTAPGGGITIQGLIRIARANHVVLRFLTMRQGKSPKFSATQQEFDAWGGWDRWYCKGPIYGPGGPKNDICGAQYDVVLRGAVVIEGGNNIVLDHISMSWSNDKSFVLWNDEDRITSDVTLSYNLIAEPLQPHAPGETIGARTAAGSDKAYGLSIHHNLLFKRLNRIPLVLIRDVVIANNLIGRGVWRATMIHGGVQADIIGNIYKLDPPPSNENKEIFPLSRDSAGQGPLGKPSIYISGNIGNTQKDPNGDNWVMLGSNPAATRRTSPLPSPAYPITLHSVNVLEDIVLNDVGNSRRLDENGNWIKRRDSVDERLINEYKTNTGNHYPPWNENEVGGWPVIANGIPYTDTDRDGMPDTWETSHGLNPNNPADANQDADGDGYTNIEEFLNGVPIGSSPAPICSSSSSPSPSPSPSPTLPPIPIPSPSPLYPAHCYNNVQDTAQGETGLNCSASGSPCPYCPPLAPATCFDNIQNNGETGKDCGGPCTPCAIAPIPLASVSIDLLNPISTSDAGKLIANILKWALSVAGSLALLMLIVGGIMYISSAGDEERIAKGKKILTWTVIGLTLILVSYAVLVVLEMILT